MKERYIDALSSEELEMKDHIRNIIDGMMRYGPPPDLTQLTFLSLWSQFICRSKEDQSISAFEEKYS